MRVILLIGLLLIPSLVQAELRVNLGAGVTDFQGTYHDGDWVQNRNAHGTDFTSITVKGGLEYAINESWSVSANYLNIGEANAWSRAVRDKDYGAHNPVPTHYTMRTTDAYQGAEVFGSYKFHLDNFQPFLTAGVAAFQHQAQGMGYYDNHSSHDARFTGKFLSARVGTGVCWKWICTDITYYKGVKELQTENTYPLSTSFMLATGYLSIPIW